MEPFHTLSSVVFWCFMSEAPEKFCGRHKTISVLSLAFKLSMNYTQAPINVLQSNNKHVYDVSINTVYTVCSPND